jgi:pimeloyl-ACP methyl ester carboxylesterase
MGAERSRLMRAMRFAALATIVVLAVVLRAAIAHAQVAALPQAHNVVLLQDASANGANWAALIPLLEAAGLHVTAVETPLSSLEASADEARRALALQDGPTVLVGHGWGGAVTSEIGVDPQVSALVYLEAAAPEAGEDLAALAVRFPGQPTTEASLVGIKVAAWRDKPSFYAVAKDGAIVAPDLQRFFASRMKAKTIVLDSAALSSSHPREVAGLILEAAGMKPAACGSENDDRTAACSAPALPRSLAEGCKCTKDSADPSLP